MIFPRYIAMVNDHVFDVPQGQHDMVVELVDGNIKISSAATPHPQSITCPMMSDENLRVQIYVTRCVMGLPCSDVHAARQAEEPDACHTALT